MCCQWATWCFVTKESLLLPHTPNRRRCACLSHMFADCGYFTSFSSFRFWGGFSWSWFLWFVVWLCLFLNLLVLFAFLRYYFFVMGSSLSEMDWESSCGISSLRFKLVQKHVCCCLDFECGVIEFVSVYCKIIWDWLAYWYLSCRNKVLI